MPWEVTIRRADSAPLGDLATVREQISTALPGVQFHRQPSGQEKIAAARAMGVEFPDIMRQHLEQLPATEQAEFEGDRLSLVLYGLDAQPLTALRAEVRGNGNPVPVLTALCVPNAWVAVDDATGNPIDLTGPAAGWESFRAYRDSAVRSLKAADGRE
jgi:hypothetical protein